MSAAPRLASAPLSTRRRRSVVAFCNKRGTCEQWIKEGKRAIRWTRLSCRRSLAANAVRLQLDASPTISATSCARSHARADQRLVADQLKERNSIKIGAKVVGHGRYVAFQVAEVATPRKPVSRYPADDWGIAAAARYIDWVMRSVVKRSTKNHGRRASCDRKFGIPRQPTASQVAPNASTGHGGVSTTFQSCQSLTMCASLSRDKAVIRRMPNKMRVLLIVLPTMIWSRRDRASIQDQALQQHYNQ